MVNSYRRTAPPRTHRLTPKLVCLWGDGGNDVLNAGSWGSVLIGGAGRDRMVGGVGDDTFYAEDGEWDIITGGGFDKGDHAYIDLPIDTLPGDWVSNVKFINS